MTSLPSCRQSSYRICYIRSHARGRNKNIRLRCRGPSARGAARAWCNCAIGSGAQSLLRILGLRTAPPPAYANAIEIFRIEFHRNGFPRECSLDAGALRRSMRRRTRPYKVLTEAEILLRKLAACKSFLSRLEDECQSKKRSVKSCTKAFAPSSCLWKTSPASMRAMRARAIISAASQGRRISACGSCPSHFQGKSPVERHRQVNAALKEELAGPVHALAIKALTPAEAAR